MDTGNLLFDFAHDTYRVQLEQMRGTQARNALMLVALSALTGLVGVAGWNYLGTGLGLSGGNRWLLALYNLPLVLAFLSLLLSLFHLRAAAGQPRHVSLVSSEEWQKVRTQYRLVRKHAASDEDLTERFLPSLLDASEQNADINERERMYFGRSMMYGVNTLVLVLVQALVHYAAMAIVLHRGLPPLM